MTAAEKRAAYEAHLSGCSICQTLGADAQAVGPHLWCAALDWQRERDAQIAEREAYFVAAAIRKQDAP